MFVGTRLNKTQQPNNVQHKKTLDGGQVAVQSKEKTRLNVFVETNEICKASKLVNVHGNVQTSLKIFCAAFFTDCLPFF